MVEFAPDHFDIPEVAEREEDVVSRNDEGTKIGDQPANNKEQPI